MENVPNKHANLGQFVLTLKVIFTLTFYKLVTVTNLAIILTPLFYSALQVLFILNIF